MTWRAISARSCLAEGLDLVDDLVATVVARAGEALGVLVGEAGAQRLHHGGAGEVLRRDQLDAAAVAGGDEEEEGIVEL